MRRLNYWGGGIYTNKTVALIPPAPSPGSFGDAAVEAVVKQSLDCQIDTINVLYDTPFTVVEPWRDDFAFENYDQAIILGTDSLDGTYGTGRAKRIFEFAKEAIEHKVPVKIASCSWRKDSVMKDEALSIDGIEWYMRDKSSVENLGRGIYSADASFLLEKAREWPDELIPFVRAIEEKRSVLVCPAQKMMPLDVDETVEAIEAIDGYAILLQHDERDTEDRDFLIEVSKKVDSLLIPQGIGIHGIRKLVASCKFGIIGRMHCLIHAICTGTPCVARPYHPKFRYMLKDLGLESIISQETHMVNDVVSGWEQRRETAQAFIKSNPSESAKLQLK